MWTFRVFSPLSCAEKMKEKGSVHVCTSQIPLLMPVGYFESERGRLGYYCSSLQTENLCRVIVLLYLYISRFLIEMSFHLTLRGINHEQKDAIQQLFESNGWPWNVEMTSVCETESTAHSLWLDNIPRSQPVALALNWQPTFPLPDPRRSESAECEFHFCVPCITTSRQSWLGMGQSAHRWNPGIRKKMYRKFWSILEMCYSWRQPVYL